MAFENMKEKQPWHAKGQRVTKSGLPGKITTFAESTIGEKKYVHTVYVELDGVRQSFPFNPNDIDKA